jgi:hypothetical protein
MEPSCHDRIPFVLKIAQAGLSLTVITLLSHFGQIEAATINAKSVSLVDVRFAVASAKDGDTVAVPAGTASWTSSLVITKSITLQGATSISGVSSSPTVTDQTVVLDEVPRKSRTKLKPKQQPWLPQKRAGASAEAALSRDQAGRASKPISSLIVMQLRRNQSFRLTGFTFRYGSVTAKIDSALLGIRGNCPSVRVDRCHFDQLYRNPFIMTNGQIYGVVDHCVLDERSTALTFKVLHDQWGGHTHGDGSWADDAYFGSEKFLFIEDNAFRNAHGYLSVGIDSYGGGRYVARHNYLVDTPIGGHGTESSGRFRGVRAVEVYNNTCVWNLVNPRGQLRSGTMLEFNNVWTGSKDPGTTSTTLTCYRQFWPFKIWGGAGGTNRLDANDTEGNGTYVAGHRPHLYASGNISDFAGTSTSGTVTASGEPNWTTNQWAKYSITNTTKTTPAGSGHSSYITSNTANTITFARDASFGPAMSFSPGDNFAIYRVLIALDQPGRGKGDLLARVDPGAGGSWPHQALEPAYAWGNVYQDGAKTARQLNLGSPYPTIQKNREFYNQKTPFDGTAGVGMGKLADRPKTCTPSVAYWATDEGEWDSTHDGPDGQLYVCTEPNTWSFYYKPYTYPHPLVTGVPASPKKRADDRRQATDVSSSSSN